jgi:excinuclease UvrABC nuclease subunit
VKKPTHYCYGLRDNKGSIIYVGSSSRIIGRIAQHRRRIPFVDFIKWACDCANHRACTLERDLIRLHRPRLNKLLNYQAQNGVYIPIDKLWELEGQQAPTNFVRRI